MPTPSGAVAEVPSATAHALRTHAEGVRAAGQALTAAAERQHRTALLHARAQAEAQVCEVDPGPMLAAAQAALSALLQDLGRAGLDFTDPGWDHSDQRGRAIPPLLRLGDLALPGGATLPALAPAGPVVLRCATAGSRRPDSISAAGPWLAGLALRLLAATRLGRIELHTVDTLTSGVPFAPLTGGPAARTAMVADRTATTPAAMASTLADLRATADLITATQLHDVPDLATYNARTSGRGEPWRVLVVLTSTEDLSTQAARDLNTLLTDGPRAGITPLVAVLQQTDPRRSTNPLTVPPAATCIDITADGSWVWAQQPVPGVLTASGPVPGPVLHATMTQLAGAYDGEANPVVHLPDLWDTPVWSATSDEAGTLSAVVGRTQDGQAHRLTLDERERAHALVVGPNGSGKSTLLHALITSLGRSYGPEELELHLLDFKQGVEFARYLPGRVTTSGLPHARVVALQADQPFAGSVIRHLAEQIATRGRQLEHAGTRWGVEISKRAQYLTEARARGEQVHMPAIVCIVDEFQGLFPDQSRMSEQVRADVDKIVRQGRFVGVHLVLCSQNITTSAGGGLSLDTATLNEIPIRICYRLKVEDAARILEPGNTTQASSLPRYHALFNEHRGAAHANTIAVPALLPDPAAALVPIDAAARAAGYPPITTSYHAGSQLSVSEVPALVHLTGAPTRAGEVHLHLGSPATLTTDAPQVPLRARAGSHLLAAGGELALSGGVVAAAALSVTAQDPHAGVLLVDTAVDADDPDEARALLLHAWGPRAVHVPADHVGERLEQLAALVKARRSEPDLPRDRVLLVGWGLEELRPELTDTRTARALTMIEELGPNVGVHLLLGFSTVSAATAVVSMSRAAHYAIKVLLDVDTPDGATRLGLTSSDNPPAGRGTLVWRAGSAHRQLIIPARLHLADPGTANADQVHRERDYLRQLVLPGDGTAPDLRTSTVDQVSAPAPITPANAAPAPAGGLRAALEIDPMSLLDIPDLDDL